MLIKLICSRIKPKIHHSRVSKVINLKPGFQKKYGLHLGQNSLSKIEPEIHHSRKPINTASHARESAHSFPEIPECPGIQSTRTLLFLPSLLSTWLHFCTSLEVILLDTKALIAA